MIGEFFRTFPLFGPFDGRRERMEASVMGFAGSHTPRVWLVVHTSLRVEHIHMPILLKIVNGALGCVDGDLSKVGLPNRLS